MRKETIIVLLTMSILFSRTIGCVANTTDGATLFEKERCICCHSFNAQGADIGPDLTGIANRRSDEWIRDQVRNPKLHSSDPRMPGHEYLSRKQINSIIKYLKS